MAELKRESLIELLGLAARHESRFQGKEPLPLNVNRGPLLSSGSKRMPNHRLLAPPHWVKLFSPKDSIGGDPDGANAVLHWIARLFFGAMVASTGAVIGGLIGGPGGSFIGAVLGFLAGISAPIGKWLM